VITGYGAIVHTAKVEPGCDRGGGGLRRHRAGGDQWAEIAGAGRIIAIDKDPGKLELAKKFGATDGIPADEDVVKRVMDLTNGGVHYSFECIGLKQTAEQCFACCAPVARPR
jgi:S-(hydroxymethyl)glutathione dehydrogenase/alcohol dehydrogenase